MPYNVFNSDSAAPDAIVVKLYPTGDTVRGYVHKITDSDQDDTIFPGEEMDPEAALRMADTHSRGEAPVFIELAEGVEWDTKWGTLEG